MTAELRIAIVGLAGFAASGLLVSLLVPLIASRWARGPAAVRARRLATLRLLPAVVSSIAGVVVTSAFLAFEPRWDGEGIGVMTPAFAGLAALLLGTAAWRWVTLTVTTRRLISGWLATATPVDLPGISAPAFAVSADFPVVAVLGLRRPRLIVARSVLAACSPEELRAILAHEQGHIDRRDNLGRLLLSVTPDVLSWLPISVRWFRAWRDAAEEAADDAAARSGENGRVRLASALIKVARLAPPLAGGHLMPASALYRGEPLDRRVRRLLESSEDAGGRVPTPWRTRAACALALVVSLSSLEDVHNVVEQLIHALP